MPQEIIIRYTGPSNQSSFQVNGDGRNLQIAVRTGMGEPEVIFTGENFSQKEYVKRGGDEKESFYLHGKK